MHKLPFCCLLFIGFLNPLASLPVTDSREAPLQLPAPKDAARLALEELERASLLQALSQVVAAGTEDGLREADPTTEIPSPKENARKVLSGQDPKIVLSRLLARTRKQRKQHGSRAECFWKYCV